MRDITQSSGSFTPETARSTAKECSCSGENAEHGPVFVVGVMNRSGTNHLADLLKRTQQYVTPQPVVEDYFAFHSSWLEAYCHHVVKHWDCHESSHIVQKELLSRIGAGIIDYASSLVADDSRSLLFKSPRARGLLSFPDLFPKSKLVILIRDGRDVCESAERSWQRKRKRYWRKEWARRWNEGAQEILSFIREHRESFFKDRWKLVRYEDLVTNLEVTLSATLQFLGINPEDYPWEEARSAPLIGSSDTAVQSSLHWKPVRKPMDFNPIGRWKETWGWGHKRVFKKIAGYSLKQLGYADSHRW